MSKREPPKIEFPCEDYPIKILGDAGDELRQLVIEVMQRHAPDFDETRISIKDSRNGTYQSVTVRITATGERQLERIHQELRGSSVTKMVL